MGATALWFRGVVASVISGAAGGVLTGMASIGLAPDKFNLQDPELVIKVALAGAVANALIGLAAYLKQSPLPAPREQWTEEERKAKNGSSS